jgi:selenide, water dikinase
LAQVLQPLKNIFSEKDFPQLLIGLNAPDDSAVYQLDEERAIISTMDFFPPVVDDAYNFGAIAAANALSDVYAMGGKPLMAINLAAFPDGLDISILSDILRGGADIVKEAGAVIAGGHTVTDKEPKYGLSVTGEVHPQRIIRKGGAQVGDKLILTKSLGTGVITTALKQGKADAEHIEAVVAGMKHLNRNASELAQQYNEAKNKPIHAMTDITGYSLLGHGHEMAHLSDVNFQIHFDKLNWYAGALAYAEADIIPGGLHRNREYFSQWVVLEKELIDWQEYLLYDPQTSGGLLIAVAANTADAFLSELLETGEQAALIGEVIAGTGHLHIL